jgi:hypothetical protein
MPGYPKERHGAWDSFVTRQTVLIVPAAPSRETTLTLAVRPRQRAIVGVDDVEDPDVAGVTLVSPVDWVAVVVCCEDGALGTVPASFAPPPQPAAANTMARKEISALVMQRIVLRMRNFASPPP